MWFSVKISLTLNSFNLQSTFQDFLSVSLSSEQVKTRLNGLGEFCCDSEVPSCLLCHSEWNSSWFFEHRPVRTPQCSEWLVLSPWPISFPLCISFSWWGCDFSVALRMSEVTGGSTFPGNGFTKAHVMSGSPMNSPSYKDGYYQFAVSFSQHMAAWRPLSTLSLFWTWVKEAFEGFLRCFLPPDHAWPQSNSLCSTLLCFYYVNTIRWSFWPSLFLGALLILTYLFLSSHSAEYWRRWLLGRNRERKDWLVPSRMCWGGADATVWSTAR